MIITDTRPGVCLALLDSEVSGDFPARENRRESEPALPAGWLSDFENKLDFDRSFDELAGVWIGWTDSNIKF